MKILFDQGTPAPPREHITEHSIATVSELGWSSLSNGALLELADQSRYDLLITTDQNLRHQQNLSRHRLAIVVLLSTSWPRIRLRVDEIRNAVNEMKTGEYREIAI